MNKERLSFGGDPTRMRMAAYNVITRTQDDPEVQVQAMAIALQATCTALDIDIKQLLVSMERMQTDLEGPFVDIFRALQEYAVHEIGRR